MKSAPCKEHGVSAPLSPTLSISTLMSAGQRVQSEAEICQRAAASNGVSCDLILDGILPAQISPAGQCLNAAALAGDASMCPTDAPGAMRIVVRLCADESVAGQDRPVQSTAYVYALVQRCLTKGSVSAQLDAWTVCLLMSICQLLQLLRACAAFCMDRTAPYEATSTISLCYPPDSQTNHTLPETYDLLTALDTCVLTAIPFEPTAADFRRAVTELYTALSPDCQVCFQDATILSCGRRAL